MKNSDWLNINVSQNNYNPTTVNDVVSGKQIKIHKVLFTDAMEKAIVDNIDKGFEIIDGEPEDYKVNIIKCAFFNKKWNRVKTYEGYNVKGYIDLSKWRIYENTNNITNYWEPTKVTCISKELYNKKDKKLQYLKIELDLRYWWSSDYQDIVNKKVKMTNSIEDLYPYNEIVEYDYINGKAKLENRVEDKKRWIKFNEISEEDKLNIAEY